MSFHGGGGGGGAHQSFKINGRSRMDVKTFFGEIRESVSNLMAKNREKTQGSGFSKGANNHLDLI